MFEKSPPVSSASKADACDDDLLIDPLVGPLIGVVDSVPDAGPYKSTKQDFGSRGGDALRMIEWGVLTARLSAARDLRQVLRRDARFNIEANASSFGDAAARYFRNRDGSERGINPVDLEACKASCGIMTSVNEDRAEMAENHGHVATVDARDN
jgi:hypothetical protein